MGTRKTYSAEFKRQAIELATQPDHTVDEIARDLGIGRSTLSYWIRMAREHGELAFPGNGKARLTPEHEELKRLRKENEFLWQERDILKSAGGLPSRNTASEVRFRPGAKPCISCPRPVSGVTGIGKWRLLVENQTATTKIERPATAGRDS